MSIRFSLSAICRNFLVSSSLIDIKNISTHSMYPPNTLERIPSSSGKLMMGVPDSPMILLLRASDSSR